MGRKCVDCRMSRRLLQSRLYAGRRPQSLGYLDDMGGRFCEGPHGMSMIPEGLHSGLWLGTVVQRSLRLWSMFIDDVLASLLML